VAERQPVERDRLRAEVKRLMAADVRAAVPIETTPEHERALRSLGYVQ
jgi:hypothetical protein